MMLLALAIAPLLVTLDAWEGWKPATAERGWQWMTFEQDACNDTAVKALEAQIAQRPDVDRSRVYLLGRGDSAACAFYAVSRLPDLWTAAVAVGGDPARAIETNRLFAANLSMVPMLWVVKPDSMRRKIPGVEEREQATIKDALDFFASKQRDQWPLKIDYETGSTKFLRCFWLEITKVDVTKRNDAVPISRISPGTGARLAPGSFKPDDKILAINGKDPKEFLEEARQEKDVAVMVQRGKDRVRVAAKVVIPVREEGLTVRIQAEVQPESKEILLLSRGITGLKLNLPERWAPATANWNGQGSVKMETPGCYLLGGNGTTVTVAPCN
jgi:hypothetical protein